MARYIRFQPTDWHVHISMRVELYGCYAGNVFFLYAVSALITPSRNVLGMDGGKIKKLPWTLNITFCLTRESIKRKYHSVIKVGKSSIHDQPSHRSSSSSFPIFSLSSLLQSPTLHQLVFSKSRIKRNRFNLLNSNYVEIDFRELEEDKYWASLLWSKGWLTRNL